MYKPIQKIRRSAQAVAIDTRKERIPSALSRSSQTPDGNSDSKTSGCTCFTFWTMFLGLLRLSGFELYIEMSLHTYFKSLIYINVNGTRQKTLLAHTQWLTKRRMFVALDQHHPQQPEENKFGYKFHTIITMRNFIFQVYLIKFHIFSCLLQE